MEFIPKDLRKYLTIYASSGTFKVTFDENGNAKTESDYNASTYIPNNIVNEIKKIISPILDS